MGNLMNGLHCLSISLYFYICPFLATTFVSSEKKVLSIIAWKTTGYKYCKMSIFDNCWNFVIENLVWTLFHLSAISTWMWQMEEWKNYILPHDLIIKRTLDKWETTLPNVTYLKMWKKLYSPICQYTLSHLTVYHMTALPDGDRWTTSRCRIGTLNWRLLEGMRGNQMSVGVLNYSCICSWKQKKG